MTALHMMLDNTYTVQIQILKLVRSYYIVVKPLKISRLSGGAIAPPNVR
jgi:hypothetical protein